MAEAGPGGPACSHAQLRNKSAKLPVQMGQPSPLTPKSPRLPPSRTGRTVEALVKFHVVSDDAVDDPRRRYPHFGDEGLDPRRVKSLAQGGNAETGQSRDQKSGP